MSLSHAPSSRDLAVEAVYNRLLDPDLNAWDRQAAAEAMADAVIEALGLTEETQKWCNIGPPPEPIEGLTKRDMWSQPYSRFVTAWKPRKEG